MGCATASEHHNIDINASSRYHHDVRTTLTLDDDVAIRLERERRKRRVSFKDVVNEVLRAGLDALAAPKRRSDRFRTKGFSLGSSLVGSLDNIEEVLSRAEGERHR
jgi:hypothetical protein